MKRLSVLAVTLLLVPLFAQRASAQSIQQVAAFYNRAAVVTSDGVYVWGAGTATPQRVEGLTGVTSVALGANHTLALKSDGTVYAWGQNKYGQLGNGAQADTQVPIQVQGLTNIVQIAAGNWHSLALRTDDVVYVWGWNQRGQLGDGTAGSGQMTLTPTLVREMTGVTQVGAGGEFSLALKGDGTLWAWGLNGNGQIGAEPGGGWKEFYPQPTQVLMDDVARFYTGDMQVVAYNGKGEAYAWGALGWIISGARDVDRPKPIRVPEWDGFDALDLWNAQAIGLKDGEVWVWGNGGRGHLAQNGTGIQVTPQRVAGLGGVTDIAAGYGFDLTLAGDVYAWGWNREGELGRGTITDRETTPARVLLPGAEPILLWVGRTTARVGSRTLALPVAPQVVGGRTFVPLRFVSEALGVEVAWDAQEKRIDLRRQGATITLWIGRTDARFGAETRTLDAAPFIDQGSTLVPLRFVAEAFGADVQWDGATKRVTITP